MRLLLVGNYPQDQQSSMLRYTEMLRRELSLRGLDVHVIAPFAWVGRLHGRGTIGKWLGYVDKYLLFPWRLRREARRWDWVHVCDHSNSVYLPWLRRDRSSITCHDLLAIEAARGNVHAQEDVGRRVGFTGRLQQRWISKHLLAAPRVVCISRATQRSLLAMRAAGAVIAISNPLNRPYAPAPLQAVAMCRKVLGLQPDEPYILHVGGNHWYKNRPGVLRIVAALRQRPALAHIRFVMAGQPWTDQMRRTAAAAGLNDDRTAGPICTWLDPSDVELEALYTGAELLLFPSLQEGFGWPLIEAQSCGTPVATTARDPMQEIAGDAAILLDPADPDDAAARIAVAWSTLPDMRQRALRNAANYTTDRLMPCYDRFFRNALAAAQGKGTQAHHAARTAQGS